jgi:hypothetical protein
MKGQSHDGRSRNPYRFGFAGCVLAYLLGVASPAIPQALPSGTVGIPTTTAPNYSWIRSVQSLSNGGTAVRYIAANSVTAPAGASSYAFATRGTTAVAPALFRSAAGSTAIRTICAERRACLVALGATAALGTLGIVASIGDDGLPQPSQVPYGDVDMSMLGLPETVIEDLKPFQDGYGITEENDYYRPHLNAPSVRCTDYYNSAPDQCRTFEIYYPMEIETPPSGDPARLGMSWSYNPPSSFGGCWRFTSQAGTYRYPEASCGVGTKLSCSSSACRPTAEHDRYVESEYELGNIIMDPSSVTITNDMARRVMEQTSFEPARLGQDSQGRAVFQSVWEVPALSPNSYASPSEIIEYGLDRWGATDAAGNLIGNPDPGWDPTQGENVADPQPNPGYTSDPTLDPELDPETGTSTGGNGTNIPQPPYDVSVINIDDAIPDGIGADVPSEGIAIPSYLDYGARWLPTSCPAPTTIDIGLAQIPFDFDATCMGLDFMSYLLVAAALISSLNMVIRSALA